MSRFRSWWPYIRKYWVATIIIALVAMGVMIFLGYWFRWDWTGFNGHIGPNVQQYQPAKTLWDWLNLLGVLAIPAVVGLGAAWYTTQQGKVSARENADNQRETALQAYIDKMSELLLEKKLRESSEDDEVRKIARVRTLTILARLDAERKRSILQFLYEAGLILVDTPANRQADTDEGIVDLTGADLSGANLSESSLFNADLDSANLRGANLRGTNLGVSVLRGANLQEADLSGAFLTNAHLERANLSGAKVTSAQLKEAKSLSEAIMPDGSLHPLESLRGI